MIYISEPTIGNEELENIVNAVKSGWISSKGEFVEKFEKTFARYCDRKYGISCSNGTTALHLALLAVNIKHGDEVIVPNLTFISPANMVREVGGKPVFVDADKDYWGINVHELEKAITKKTKAIIVVHLYGHPCDMDKILEISEKYNLYIIEDAAEAHGAKYKDKRVGSFGDISCFSFFGNKNMTTGEGGICLTDDEKIADKINILKNHGMSKTKKYWHDEIGYNYRMTNIQAAIGLAQIGKLDKIVEKKNLIANQYYHELKNLIAENKIIPHPKMPWAENVIWLYTILLNNKTEKQRDEIINKLAEKGIETRPFFYPLNKMPPYQSNKSFPISEEISLKGISLPSSARLKKEEVRFVCNELKKLI